MGLFSRNTIEGKTQVPVWFMRQAGRYHQHYQSIKATSDFMSMCKDPLLAQKITHGPLDEFGFDAAILFSDLLFPLEYLGMGLNYHQGPPRLEFHLENSEALKKLKTQGDCSEFFSFQKKACELLKASLPTDRDLLGFAGAPFTLYTYAVEGSHAGSLVTAKKGLSNGLFKGFMEVLSPVIIRELELQAEGGADALCLFDTAAGELDFFDYQKFIIPEIKSITQALKKKHPQKKIIYYSKHTQLHYLEALEDNDIDVLGIDWRVDLKKALQTLGKDYLIQGNLDPVALHLPWENLKAKWDKIWREVQDSGASPDHWIAALGHGVLQFTPEENVRRSVEYIHQNFHY